MRQLAKTIATGFGSGYLPFAPGSWGSAAILLPAILIQFFFGWQGLLYASVILFFIGALAVKLFLKSDPRRDPPEITIDEMAAQLLVVTAVDLNFASYLWAFVLFRIFDIVKPWPISLIEAKFPPVLAIMLDDMAAALYALLILILFRYFDLIGIIQ